MNSYDSFGDVFAKIFQSNTKILIFPNQYFSLQTLVTSVRNTTSRAFASNASSSQQKSQWNNKFNNNFASLAAATFGIASTATASIALCEKSQVDPKTQYRKGSYVQATSPEQLMTATTDSGITAEEQRLEEAASKAKRHAGGLKLFSGNGNLALSMEIARTLGINLGKATVGKFADGEVNIQVHENVRGKDVYVIQPTCPPVNSNLMELLLMVSTLNRASARRITVVIPYYGYARQDRKMQVKFQ